MSNATVEDLCNAALAALDAGSPADCLPLLAKAKVVAPGNSRVHYLLGLYFTDVRQLDHAINAFDESLRLDPANAKAHNNRGSTLLQLGRTGEAEAAFRTALDLDPALDAPYANLGHLLEQRGDDAAADALYARAIERGVNREMFEQHRAAIAGRNTKAMPDAMVRATFDNFAPAFDQRLRALGYNVPEDLAHRLRQLVAPPLDILDLGCGTGFCGVALRDLTRRIVGVDLSGRMLQQAERRGIYDALHAEEIASFMKRCHNGSYDLAIAADVLVYVGELDALVEECARVLRDRGWLAFSTEEQNERDYVLQRTGRYAHAQAYVERIAREAFDIRCADPTVVRLENGVPVAGRLYILQRR